MEAMTTKQLAEVAGVHPDTIRRTAKVLYPHKLVHGKTAKFNSDEASAVIKQVKKKNLVGELPQIAGVESQNAEVASENIRGLLSDSDLAKIALIVSQVVNPRIEAQNERLERLEDALEKQTPMLPPPVSDRGELNRLVKKYAQDSGTPYALVWRTLYSEYKYRYGVDIYSRAKHRNMDTLEYADAENLTGQLVLVARALWGIQ